MNILFIAIDDLRPTLGCYGDSFAKTPNIDQLASQGILFNRAYCQQAVCAPSRSSLMTGLRPDKIQVWDLKKHFRETLPSVVTLPQFFKNKGYVTSAVGKIYHDPKNHQDPVSWSGETLLNVTKNSIGHKYADAKNIVPKKKGPSIERLNVKDNAYIDGKVTDATLKVLNEVKDSAFFLAVGFRRPHLPFTAPEKYWALYDDVTFNTSKNTDRPLNAPEIAFHDSQELRGYSDIPTEGELSPQLRQRLWQGYYASTSYIDAQIGKLINELERLQLKDNTIIVVWSDHGYHLGEQGQWAKATNFEKAVRVPLIISVPGMKNQGSSSSSLVELVDLYPTLAHLCGFQIPEKLDGKSLKPIFKDPDAHVKDFALSQFGRPYRSIFNSEGIEVMGYSIRTDRYRYTAWYNTKDVIVAEELYDHEKDPGETINIVNNAEKALLDKLRNKLQSHI